MSLITYPCADCKLSKMDSGTGVFVCTSHLGPECERWDETARIESFIYDAVDLFGHRHLDHESRADIARGMATGFGDALTAQGAALDEDEFLHMCGVKS
jgi:hypothetical protein